MRARLGRRAWPLPQPGGRAAFDPRRASVFGWAAGTSACTCPWEPLRGASPATLSITRRTASASAFASGAGSSLAPADWVRGASAAAVARTCPRGGRRERPATRAATRRRRRARAGRERSQIRITPRPPQERRRLPGLFVLLAAHRREELAQGSVLPLRRRRGGLVRRHGPRLVGVVCRRAGRRSRVCPDRSESAGAVVAGEASPAEGSRAEFCFGLAYL